MKLLDEIRRQPLHIRQIFMWCMVVITFSVIGLTYFRSTKKEILALLNPQEVTNTQDGPVAPERSPFALIFDSFSDLKANISELIRGNNTPLIQTQTIQTPVPPQKLP